MSKKFYADHEEVFHYTTATGLRGIAHSKTLWASHSRFLNDTEEGVSFCKRILPMILRSEFRKYVAESEELSARVQAADHLGVNLFDYWLERNVQGLQKAQHMAQDHYVMSFSTTKDEWISQNGLLSQWRGYGLDGGYAIVFDAKELADLLNTERELYHEEGWAWGDVQYNMEEFSSVQDEQVLEHFQSVRKAAYAYWTTADIEKAYPAFESIELLSAFCKHRGFEEEGEVRMVVSMPSPEMGQDLSNESGKPYRKVSSYLRDGVPVPCIHLFEGQKLKTLPIRRVIVGPHPEKQDRKRAVEILLRDQGINAKVLVLDTPFRGK
jgi:hypothetical protein